MPAAHLPQLLELRNSTGGFGFDCEIKVGLSRVIYSFHKCVPAEGTELKTALYFIFDDCAGSLIILM